MKRVRSWLLPILGVAQLILVRTGIFDAHSTVWLVALIEVVLLFVAGTQAYVAVQTYRRRHASGHDGWHALEDGFAVLMPRRVARIAVLEPQLWYCLLRWLFRRHQPNQDAFAYYKRAIIGPMLLVAFLTAPVEIAVGAILLPWAWVRTLFLIGTLYTLFWMVGFYASLRVLPHQLEHDGVRIRFGAFAEGFIPYHMITGIAVERRKAPGGRDGLQLSPRKTIAYLAMGGRTDVTLTLRDAQTLEGLGGATAPVQVICVAADVPQDLAAALGTRVGLPVRIMQHDSQRAMITRPVAALFPYSSR